MIDVRDRIVVGAPGGFAIWTFNMLTALANIAKPEPIEVRLLKRLEEVPPAPPRGPGRLILTHCPTSQIIEALATSPLRFVYLDEPSPLVLKYLVEGAKLPLLQALRVATASYVGNIDFARSANLAVISRDIDLPIAEYLAGLCRFLDIPVSTTDIEHQSAAVSAIGAAGRPIEASIVKLLPNAAETPFADPVQGELAARLGGSVIDPLIAYLKGTGRSSITLPGDIFNIFKLDALYDKFGPQIDLTGPARILLHGPYLYLPRARFSAHFTNVCDRVFDDNTFRIEVHSGSECVARVRYRPGQMRRFTGSFSFTHVDVGAEVQVQTIAERGAIDGVWSLESLVLDAEPL